MWATSDIIRLFSLFFNLVSGLTLNSYIITMYVQERRKKRGFNVSDKVVLLLALTGIIFQCTCTSESLIFYFGSHLPHGRSLYTYIFAFYTFLMCGSIWNTAWLSSYYCFKLVKCSHRIFLQLKKKLSSSMTPLLLVSMVLLFLITLPLPWSIRIHYKNVTADSSANRHNIQVDVPYVPLYIVFGSLVPFLLCFICIGLSVMSLLSHVQQIRHNSFQFTSSPQLEGHFRAVRTMILQVCLCLALCLAVFSMLLLSPHLAMITRIFIFILITSYSSLQAIISIQGNPKLRNRAPDTARGSK